MLIKRNQHLSNYFVYINYYYSIVKRVKIEKQAFVFFNNFFIKPYIISDKN